jgi:hypothetical protein
MNVSNEWAMLWSYKLVSLGASYFATEFYDRDFSKQSNAALDLGRECNSFEKSLGCRWEREGRSNKFVDFSLKPSIFVLGVANFEPSTTDGKSVWVKKNSETRSKIPKKEYIYIIHTHINSIRHIRATYNYA